MSLIGKNTGRVLLLFFFTCLFCAGQVNPTSKAPFLSQNTAFAQVDDDEFYDPFAKEQNHLNIADPLEPLNRAFFTFNDRLYFWILKPTSTVYSWYFPEGVRIRIRHAFHNALAPVRIVNNLLQGKLKPTGVEIARFAINSTLGVAGLFDPAMQEFNLRPHDEDFGQTLGVYGLGYGFYINWPFLGPSSARDSIGLIGDFFLDPIFYVTPNWWVSGGVKAGDRTNDVSLRIGEYEDIKASALDPYIAIRDGYIQYRKERIRN